MIDKRFVQIPSFWPLGLWALKAGPVVDHIYCDELGNGQYAYVWAVNLLDRNSGWTHRRFCTYFEAHKFIEQVYYNGQQKI